MYVIREYDSMGSQDPDLHESTTKTFRQARDRVRMLLARDHDCTAPLYTLRWTGGPGCIVAYHAGQAEGCGGYEVYRVED